MDGGLDPLVTVSIHAPRVGCDKRWELFHTEVSSFNSRTPCGVRLALSSCRCPQQLGFNSRTPCGVRQRVRHRQPPRCKVSIHAPRVGCDQTQGLTTIMSAMFQFTHPVWGATSSGCKKESKLKGFNSRTPCGVRQSHWICLLNAYKFQFTHPVWGATAPTITLLAGYDVSIHAPRVGCDLWFFVGEKMKYNVSIHAPRVGCDKIYDTDLTPEEMFQFTHPVWGATIVPVTRTFTISVSIHAPRVGCDGPRRTTLDLQNSFQFTHPVWGATSAG